MRPRPSSLTGMSRRNNKHGRELLLMKNSSLADPSSLCCLESKISSNITPGPVRRSDQGPHNSNSKPQLGRSVSTGKDGVRKVGAFSKAVEPEVGGNFVENTPAPSAPHLASS